MSFGRVYVIVALLLTGTARLSSQSSPVVQLSSKRIIGIFDAQSGAPIEGVQVRDAFSGTVAVTTATGAAPLGFLTARGGAHLVQLRKLGYQSRQIILSADDTTAVTEVMERLTQLAPIVTTARYRIDRDEGRWAGFEQRCQSTSVTCFRDEDLTRNPSANIGDFLLRAPGVAVGACGGGASASSRSTQCGMVSMHSLVIPPAYCQPTFFIDGQEWNSSMGAPADLKPGAPAMAPFTPTNVKAIEVYSPERVRPSRFQGNPTCGVVVLWTK